MSEKKEINNNKKKEFTVINVPPYGKSRMLGGAWCLVWVYSSRGNFMLKGYMQECEDYIKNNGWKCWAIFNLYCTKKNISFKSKSGYRTIIKTFGCDFKIFEPSSNKKTAKDWKFKIFKKDNYKKSILIKRLPNRFVDFDLKK